MVQLWIAEGFVHAEGDLTLEATGEEYFRELIRRSLLQPDPHHLYVGWSCTMYDLLRSLGHFLTRDGSLVVIGAAAVLQHVTNEQALISR